MKTIGDMTYLNLEHFIEQKILEICGDPDAGLELNEDFKEKLKISLASRKPPTPHREIVEKFK